MRTGFLFGSCAAIAALALFLSTSGAAEARVLGRVTGGSTSRRDCFVQAVAAGHSLRFAAASESPGGTASLTLRRRSPSVLLAEAPACDPSVLVGHPYRAALQYTSTVTSLSLQVLAHTRAGWRVWYTAAPRLRPSRSFLSRTVLLRPVQPGVDHVALGLLLTGTGRVQAKGFNLIDASEHTPAHTPVAGGTATTPASPTTPSTPTTPETPAAPAGPGRWHVLEDVEQARTVHSVLLQNGKLLLMAGSGNSRMEFEAGKFRSFIYDPVANTWKELKTPKDVFCSGHVQLADGNVLILGGTSAYPPPTKPGEEPSTKYKGENDSWIFNIRNETYEEVPWDVAHPNQPSEPGPLLSGVWYPSATELGNGDVISFGGLNEKTGEGATSTNFFIDPDNTGSKNTPGQWVGWESEIQQTYGWFWGLYPSMILTADGRLFYDGSHVFGNGIEGTAQAPSGSAIYDFWCTPGKTQAEEEKETSATNPNAIVKGPNGEFRRITDTPGLTHPDQRDQSASLLLPPAQAQKVMIMGGGNTYEPNTPATSSTQEINLSEANPKWVNGPELPAGEAESGTESMGQGKMYVSAVALPDGTVMETGGSLYPRTDDVHEASIFNPATNSFTSIAPDPVGRNYHSEALLLPDGRVLTLGSNPANPVTGQESFETRLSIYEPPYLFDGPRPVLNAIDGEANHLEGSFNHTGQWEYGTEHTISYSTSVPISSAVLIRPAAVTHSSDPNQREVDLTITQNTGSGTLKVGLTSNSNLAPPGYYMVFLVNSKGVPSVAQWVHVGPQGQP
jgi:hypothetical protein